MAKGVTIVIQGDGESAARALELVRENLKKTGETAKHEASEIAEAMERVTSALERVGLYLGAREAIEGMKELVTSSLELGESLQKANQQTGLAVETLSVLHYAAAMTGSSFEGLTSAASKMGSTIGAATQGDKKAKAFLKDLGLNAQELAGRTDGAEIAFKTFAQTLAATENPVRRLELAKGLLGKAGADLIPMLIEVGSNYDEFKSKAQAAGVYLDGAGAAAFADTNHRLEDLKQHVLGGTLAFGEGFTPAFSQMIGVITGGKSSMDALKQWGEDIGRVFAFTGEVAYSTASAMETLFAAGEGGKFTEAGRRDIAAAEELKKKAQELHDVAFGASKKDDKPFIPESKGNKTAPYEGIGDQTGSKKQKTKSDDSIDRAAVSLAEAQAEAQAAAMRAGNARILAELEEGHKAQLLSDSEFYLEKLLIEKDSLDAEAEALRKKQVDLQTLYTKERGDKLLKRDKAGNSAEELRTRQQMVGIEEKLNALAEKRSTLDTGYDLAAQTRADDVRLATARMAAALEEQTNTTITARLALLRLENQEELEKIGNSAGKDSPEYTQAQALDQLKEAKLQIGDVNRQITETENDYKRAVEELNDAATKDPRLKTAAQKQINALNAQEAAQLRDLVVQYDALAATLGGPYIEAAKNLHAELDKLGRPDRRDDAQFTKSLVTGVEDMSKRIADSATRGRESFHQMAAGIGKDLLDLAIKLAEQKWLTPLLLGNGGQFPGASSGGGTSAIGLLGAAAPSLLGIKSPAAGVGGGVLSQLGTGAAKSAPSVKIMITNATSQPVTARETGHSFSEDAKDFVVHAVLENASSGGMLAHLFG